MTDRAAPAPPRSARRRTRAREAVLQLLYEWDVGGDVPADWQARLDETLDDDEGRVFARRLFEGVLIDQPALDARLEAAATHWALSRMACIDRNVLRLGAWELLALDRSAGAGSPAAPAAVVINEAIELAKRYSTEQSGAFVNGILDRLRIEREQAAAAPVPGAK